MGEGVNSGRAASSLPQASSTHDKRHCNGSNNNNDQENDQDDPYAGFPVKLEIRHLDRLLNNRRGLGTAFFRGRRLPLGLGRRYCSAGTGLKSGPSYLGCGRLGNSTPSDPRQFQSPGRNQKPHRRKGSDPFPLSCPNEGLNRSWGIFRLSKPLSYNHPLVIDSVFKRLSFRHCDIIMAIRALIKGGRL